MRDVLIRSSSPGWEGEDQVAVAAGWQVRQLQCKPGPEGTQTRPRGRPGSLHEGSRVSWPRSLFCYGQDSRLR